jgi:hypothetical protein
VEDSPWLAHIKNNPPDVYFINTEARTLSMNTHDDQKEDIRGVEND